MRRVINSQVLPADDDVTKLLIQHLSPEKSASDNTKEAKVAKSSTGNRNAILKGFNVHPKSMSPDARIKQIASLELVLEKDTPPAISHLEMLLLCHCTKGEMASGMLKTATQFLSRSLPKFHPFSTVKMVADMLGHWHHSAKPVTNETRAQRAVRNIKGGAVHEKWAILRRLYGQYELYLEVEARTAASIAENPPDCTMGSPVSNAKEAVFNQILLDSLYENDDTVPYPNSVSHSSFILRKIRLMVQ